MANELHARRLVRKNPSDIVSGINDEREASISRTNGAPVALERNIGLPTAISIIMGCIIGSGIFISPKGVLLYSGSVGTALIVWGVCGIVAFLGALCYAELGTTIKKSGGDYTYLYEVYGSFMAFLMIWVYLAIIGPGNISIISQTFAVYAIAPFYPDCDPPQLAVVLVSESCIFLIYFYNCITVRGTAWVQIVTTIAKVFGLLIIIVVGIVQLFQGQTEYLNFDGPGTSITRISLALYAGLFSYGGWTALNAITEELNKPNRDFPVAASVSMLLITAIYVMTNIAYFTAMSPTELLRSPAVAVTFGDKLLGDWAWTMPVVVAISTFGTTNGSILTSSRIIFACARDGYLPDLLSMVQMKYNSPMPSLIIMIPIIIPIFFAMFAYFLVFVSIFSATMEAVIGLIIILTGVPVYFYSVWTNKPRWLSRMFSRSKYSLQKLMLVMKQEIETY
uniref:Large neutral amino acids transporter small subunit 1-like n=1 Tax=Saccoglossus kowalevskii TaxID=10224 RepID=A0ABM0GJ07_SACKO|nr:PREDICTED: large neutral amino acids transporter small subunit 1-like [Saccoglossus kowalevskii]